MIFKCPGSQNFSQPHPEFIKCVFCGGEIEIWSDEIKAVCPGCNKTVTRGHLPNCLDWCRYAEECAGQASYKKYIKNKTLDAKRADGGGGKRAKQKNLRDPKRTDE